MRIDGEGASRAASASEEVATLASLIERIASQPKVATYLDVPMQHIDTDVLKKMRRGYTEKTVRELVERVRAASNKIWLRTTMLVGHPGETEAAFDRLRTFVGEGWIDHLGVFPWSREEGTASAIQPGRVEEELAKARAEELMAMQAELREAAQQELVGQEIEVLVEGFAEESDLLLQGRHEGQAPLLFKAQREAAE